MSCAAGSVSPALVEGVDLHPVVRVLLQDFLCVLVRVEGVHEDQRDISVVRLVQVLRALQTNTINFNQAQLR